VKTNPARFVLSVVKFLGTPLFIATLLAAMVAITRAREGNWDQAALATSIALACGGAGVAAARWVRLHARAVGTPEQLRTASPDKPWMWREDWAAGEVSTSVRRDANRLTLIAIAWCVVTSPILFIAPHRALRDADYSALPSLIFPLVGIAMLAWAMRLRRRLRQYGESRFTLASMPGQIGGSLSGSIQIDYPLPAGQQVALELECINRTTRGAWHNLTTWDWILWRSDQTSMSDSTGSIPVAFMIAPDSRPTDDSNLNSRIVWRLSARAAEYRAEFEVPVFRIGN
jgi:hypothetical protein